MTCVLMKWLLAWLECLLAYHGHDSFHEAASTVYLCFVTLGTLSRCRHDCGDDGEQASPNPCGGVSLASLQQLHDSGGGVRDASCFGFHVGLTCAFNLWISMVCSSCVRILIWWSCFQAARKYPNTSTKFWSNM